MEQHVFKWDFAINIIGRGYELSMSAVREVAIRALSNADMEYMEVWRDGKYVMRIIWISHAIEFLEKADSQVFVLKLFMYGRSHN